ncbi:MAG: aromatic ring-hydroxylating dioxygenase subunit alpha [Pseudomonadota bacterium]
MHLRSEDSYTHMTIALKREQDKAAKIALDPYFYQSELVYREELHHILFKSWIYAGHSSQIPKQGDYLTLELGEDSIIIVRDEEDEIRALANTCRHRGARVCELGTGSARMFACPYHAWVYNLDGSLRAARHMGEDFDKSNYPLKSLSVCVFEGLIFINADPEAADLQDPLSNIQSQLGAYQLDNAKVAHQETYRIEANWKLCLENYLECYHCGPAHKSYAASHTLQDTYERVQEQVSAMLARAPQVTGVQGIEQEHLRIYANAEGFGACVYHGRYGLYDGYVTGSEDGKPVAPLMGHFQDYDGGVGDFQIGPVSFMLNYPDHCVLYRFLPRGRNACDADIVWFVNKDAEEGKDYDLDRLIWLWHNTTLEDKFIITRNRDGVHSLLFEPGPLQPEFEENLQDFIEWYVQTLQRGCEAR